MEAAELYLRRITFLLINEGFRARGFVRRGHPAETILQVAAEERAELVALSTHGRTGMSRWVFGSVTERVLRASETPLLVIRCAELSRYDSACGTSGSKAPLFRA